MNNVNKKNVRLIFATHNKHKLSEIQQLLAPTMEVVSLENAGFFEAIEETGTTLEENALLKAKIVHSKFNINTFADDTGLEVDALGGAPGVYSARFAGESNNAEKNIEKLLDLLKGVKNRKARFKTIIALIHNNKEYFFEGVVEGQILLTPKGENGFGYDPVFQADGQQFSFAETDVQTKNAISHRGKAISKLVEFLNQNT
jgi:XTP/dITP diphosphohydrolase